MSKQILLVILAHLDDESFPIGGVLAKYADPVSCQPAHVLCGIT